MTALLPFLSLAALTTRQVAPGYEKIGIHPPKLVVLISVDQFRGDYVERFSPYFLPAKVGAKLGGFKFLMETGAHFRNAMHNHIPTATGPGHATLMSGSEPAIDGIVDNEWFDRASNKPIYCVSDPSVQTVGGTTDPMSPRNLLVTTVGDELKMATNGKSKVVGVAIKDRAAILMAGHAADTVVWYDTTAGNWVTSSWYAPSGKLPAWTQQVNDGHPINQYAGKSWEPLLPNEAYELTRKAPAEKASPNSKVFSHPMEATPGKALYDGITSSQFGNEVSFDVAEKSIVGEHLGQNDVPDILVINLSTNDYVGHRFGPNSPEVMDITVRTDRLLSEFLNKLNEEVPGGIDNVAVVLTGDHGVVPIPEESNQIYKTGAIRGIGATVVKAVQASLTAKYGDGAWTLGSGLYDQDLYLNRKLVEDKGLKMPDVESVAAEAASSVQGVFAAYTRTQILNNQLPSYAFRDRIVNGFNASRGGDVMVIEGPGNYPGDGTGTGHGTVWDYDAHVPILIRAKGIKPGVYLNRVHTSDIAPTLCRLLGIESPSGNVGVPLVDTLGN